ncbi:protein lines [Anopheles cruzii]|uniref:protein lines n=1 Tax=Anopheles cruzii TaxID=68878 RepID=UPI0022EC1CA7|nr:protein lines [Anopheles cruzii]
MVHQSGRDKSKSLSGGSVGKNSGNAGAGSGTIMDPGRDMMPSESSPNNSATAAAVNSVGTGGAAPVNTTSMPYAGAGVERISHEQPVIKRQRIEEHDRGPLKPATHHEPANNKGLPTTGTTVTASGSTSGASSACSSSTSLSSSPSCSSSKLIHSSLDHSSSDDEPQHLQTQQLSTPNPGGWLPHHQHHHHHQHHYHQHQPRFEHQQPRATRPFQDAIARQCLCTVEMGALLVSFQPPLLFTGGREETIAGAIHQYQPLAEWPVEHLLKFLSNVQLLFDTYLKQNIKGTICTGVVHLFDYLIHGDRHQQLVALDVDELIGLCGHRNRYISYLAGRILTSFLIIVKDYRWMEKIVKNLFDYGRANLLASDFRTVQKIDFGLEVIKRIVEWKDEMEHPLEEETAGGGPSLADNYFATHYASSQPAAAAAASSNIFRPATSASSGGDDDDESNEDEMGAPSASNPSTPGTASSQEVGEATNGQWPLHSLTSPSSASSDATGTVACRHITLTDSESFDTKRIKFETINILSVEWPRLVKSINSLFQSLTNSAHDASVRVANETCILTFLRLWESIISVKANLSVLDTQRFHEQLHEVFQLQLLGTKNCVIYRQMLTLFSEALCYGSTLALQDFIPETVGKLAENVVKSVKDGILNNIPKATYSNHIGFLGYKGPVVRYHDRRLQRADGDGGDGDTLVVGLPTGAAGGGGVGVPAPPSPAHGEMCYDRTLLQKMALLVLKAVAVIGKEIRCDSSDSSVDSSDYDMQEIQMIELSIWNVVGKLETFLKAQLEFHPDTHFSKVMIHLFDDQDDYLVEAMVCTLDVTSGISFRHYVRTELHVPDAIKDLIAMLNPVYTFIEFSNLGPNITQLFLDLLISTETCFLLFLLRFLKYIRQNWPMFTESCYNYYRHNSYSNASTLLQNRLYLAPASAGGDAGGPTAGGGLGNGAVLAGMGVGTAAANSNAILDSVMTVLVRLRMQISRLVADGLFPYDICPILRLIENCEELYEGSELS